MPPAYYAALMLAIAAAVFGYRGGLSAPGQVAVVFVIVLGVFTATLTLVALGVITSAWLTHL